MDVLEHEHRRASSGDPLEEHPCGREEVLLVAARAALETEEVRQPALDEAPFVAVLEVELDGGSELGERRLVWLVLEHPRPPADHLRKCPERDAVAVREASPSVPEDVLRETVDVLLELPRQP